MRALVQRVSSARVEVEGEVVGEIGPGFLVFVGAEVGDEESDLTYTLDKVVNLRVFEDDAGRMNLSLLEVSGELLVVSQFTLLGDVRRGRRPSFVKAMKPPESERLYEAFIEAGRERGLRVASGVFGAMMKVALVNDGPVTIMIDSRKRF